MLGGMKNDEKKRSFFLVIFFAYLRSSYRKGGFSYSNCYLIDKKGYRGTKFFTEKSCGLKRNAYFCLVKMTKKKDRFCYQSTNVNTCTLYIRVHMIVGRN